MIGAEHLPAVDVVRFDANGLVPAVIQERSTGRVLMIGYMNADALRRTRATGEVHFWSRSRQTLWHKGETSGNVQRVLEIRVNCEQNSLLVMVEQVGAVCHDGYPTCFYRTIDAEGDLRVTETRVFDPAEVYGEVNGDGSASDLPSLAVAWYGAFVWLRDHDLAAESSTSRRLWQGADVRGRIADELGELAGVLAGTHGHRSLDEDLRLEAGQVLYWLALSAVSAHLDTTGLVDGLLRPAPSFDRTGDGLALRALGCLWPTAESSEVPALIRQTASVVAAATIRSGVQPHELIEDDLASLRTRPYLATWFATVDRTATARS